MLAKLVLQCVQSVGRTEPLDGGDLGPIDLDRKSEARARTVAIQKHGAGAADAVLTADMGAGQAEGVAEEVRQQQTRLDIVDVVPGSIHCYRELGQAALLFTPLALW